MLCGLGKASRRVLVVAGITAASPSTYLANKCQWHVMILVICRALTFSSSFSTEIFNAITEYVRFFTRSALIMLGVVWAGQALLPSGVCVHICHLLSELHHSLPPACVPCGNHILHFLQAAESMVFSCSCDNATFLQL